MPSVASVCLNGVPFYKFGDNGVSVEDFKARPRDANASTLVGSWHALHYHHKHGFHREWKSGKLGKMGRHFPVMENLGNFIKTGKFGEFDSK